MSTILTEAQLARLPKFARDEIKRLGSSVDYWQAKAGEGPAYSDTFADRIVGVAEYAGKPLGKGTSVTFQYGPDERDSITVRVRDAAVEVVTSRNLLFVQPRSSNVIGLTAADR